MKKESLLLRQKPLGKSVSVWSIDGKVMDTEIDKAIMNAYEQGKKESLLLRNAKEKALAKKYMLFKLNWVILLLSSQMNKKKIKTFVEGEIVAINNEKEFENWWSNERKAD